jgi:hypothetical protein
MHRLTTGIATVAVGVLLAACSSDSGTESPGTTAASADPCASVDALRGSLTALGDVQVVEDGTEAVQDAWTTVQDDWARLVDDVGDRYADQVDDVQAAADDVGSALDAAQGDPTTQTLADVVASIGVFLQAAETLAEEVGSQC